MDEDKLIKIVKPYLDKCRSGDWNHALRVVQWIKKLGNEREDLNLLITAAYIHDIGWFNIFPEEKVDFHKMLEYEKKANENTLKYVKEVLSKTSFSEKDTKVIIRLIMAADKHYSEKNDEAIIVDADNLSKLCVEHIKEKYTPESYQEIIDLWKKEFPKRIKTKEGKSIYPKLLKDLKNFMDGDKTIK